MKCRIARKWVVVGQCLAAALIIAFAVFTTWSALS